MSLAGRLAAVVAVVLELFGTRAARADAGAAANHGGHLRRAKVLRLDLSLDWQQPPARSLIPPAGSSAAPNTPAPPPAPPSGGANGAQVAMAIIFTLIGDTAGLLVAGGTDSTWAGAIPWAIAPFGAAALVCKAGGRSGRCRATLAGALIGAAVGLLPGVLILASAGSRPNEEDAYNTYINNRIAGFEVTFLLYGIAVPVGTVIGYNVGGATQPNAVTMPQVATEPIFALQF